MRSSTARKLKSSGLKIQRKNETYASFISMDSRRADKKFLLRYQLLLKLGANTVYTRLAGHGLKKM